MTKVLGLQHRTQGGASLMHSPHKELQIEMIM